MTNVRYRKGMNAGFFTDCADVNNTLETGWYVLRLHILSGSVARYGITYTDENQFGTNNVVRAWVMKQNAQTSSDYWVLSRTSGLVTVSRDITTSLFCLYVYDETTFDNVELECYIEKLNYDNNELRRLWEQSALLMKSLNIVKYPKPYSSSDPVCNNVNGYTIKSYGTKVFIDGAPENTSKAVVLECDSDRLSYTDPISPLYYVHWREGANNNFFEDDIPHVNKTLEPGRYKFVFHLLSGSVTRGSTTYTSENQFGSTNVVRPWLFKAGATTTDDWIVNNVNNANREFTITSSNNNVSLMCLYIYTGTIFDNTEWEVYVEKTAEDTEIIADDESRLPSYWDPEIETSIQTINNNILNSSNNSSTVCFITDTHWSNNQQYSPIIVNKLLGNCNIDFFVNGGDLLQSHKTVKEDAVAEIQSCINAFKNSKLPMITLYGNHDRNRNNNEDHQEAYISASEHANLVFKSFMSRCNITLLKSDYSAFYWEDKNYRYVGLYWYHANSRDETYMQDMFNTTKPVVIFCHGIYYVVSSDGSSDTIDNQWVLNLFEPYKSKIKCFIQGHVHRDFIRLAWGEIPIIGIDCDTTNVYATPGTTTEQSVSVITIDTNEIKIVKCGKGEDFTVNSSSTNWRYEYPTTT